MTDKQQEPNKAQDSKVSDPQEKRGTGVQILSGHGEGQGVERISTREPGQLETTVETALHDASALGPDGKRQWK